MDFFRRYGAPADTSAAASKHSEDEIYPLHMLDDTKTLRGFVTTWTLRFDDVLDSDLLRNTLTRLLEIGDWRKLGGRLRLNVRGSQVQLSIHKLTMLTNARQAVSWNSMYRDHFRQIVLLSHTHAKLSTAGFMTTHWQEDYHVLRMARPFNQDQINSATLALAAMLLSP